MIIYIYIYIYMYIYVYICISVIRPLSASCVRRRRPSPSSSVHLTHIRYLFFIRRGCTIRINCIGTRPPTRAHPLHSRNHKGTYRCNLFCFTLVVPCTDISRKACARLYGQRQAHPPQHSSCMCKLIPKI